MASLVPRCSLGRSGAAEHPELDAAPYDSEFTDEHGSFATLGDLFRQIGYDERVHKNESLGQVTQPRFD